MKNRNPFPFNYMVRFHLGRDKDYSGNSHFMHWRIEKMSIECVGFTPTEGFVFVMTNAFLRNRLGAAKKIHSGKTKTVCAWVECEAIELVETKDFQVQGQRVHYSPAKLPYWHLKHTEGNKEINTNVDYTQYERLISVNNQIFIPSLEDLQSL